MRPASQVFSLPRIRRKRHRQSATTAHSWARFGKCSNRKEPSWSRYRRIRRMVSSCAQPTSLATFDDAQLAKFQRFAPFIVEAELGRTAVTDAGIETLAQFKNLRALHLEGTAVSGRTLGQAFFSVATHLLESERDKSHERRSRSVEDRWPNLRHLYLFNTPAEPASTADSGGRSTQ